MISPRSLLSVSLKPWQRRVAYGAFAVLAFAYAFHATFPADAVLARLTAEAAAAGWTVNAADSEPAGLAGVHMTGVTLQRGTGAKIGLDSVRATIRILPLFIGRRGVDFEARAFDGRIDGLAEASGSRSRLAAEIASVDLARAPALRGAIGVPLAGTLRGDVDLTVDQKDPARSKGHVDLTLENAAILPGPIPLPGMAAGLTVPRVRLGTFVAHAEAKDGRAVFQRLEATGGDLQLTGQDFYFGLQPRIALAPLYGKAQLAIQPTFWNQPEAARLKPLLDMALASARSPDGSYAFQVYGTLANPQVRLGAAPGPGTGRR